MKKSLTNWRNLLLIGATMVMACNKESGPALEEREIQITTGITKVNNGEFEINDQIGLFISDDQNQLFKNAKATLQINSWEVDPQIFWGRSARHEIIGISPYNTANFYDDIAALKVGVATNQTLFSDYAKGDILAAQTTSMPTSTPINLEFSHMMSNLEINIAYTQEFSLNEIYNALLTVENVYPNAEVNLRTKSITTTKDTGKTIIAYGNGKHFYAILPPQDFNTISLSIAGKSYQYTHTSNIALQQGKITAINLKLGRERLTLEAEMQINSWEDIIDITSDGTLTEESFPDTYDDWDRTIATEFAGGNGTDIFPYLIASSAQLAYLADRINNHGEPDNNTHYKLVRNLNLKNHEWTPIGLRLESSFKGHFDGNGKTIKGMLISENSDYAGLFGVTSGAHIQNLNLDEGSIEVTVTTGAFVGWTIKNSSISNCHNLGVSINGRTTGGIIGLIEGANMVYGCSNLAPITGSYSGGGIVGENNVGSITNSHNNGQVTAPRSGGIVGLNNEGTITDSYNTGQITATSTKPNEAGGIIGTGIDKCTSCYNTGVITGQYIGAIVGAIHGETSYASNCYYGNGTQCSQGIGYYSRYQTNIVGPADSPGKTEQITIWNQYNCSGLSTTIWNFNTNNSIPPTLK